MRDFWRALLLANNQWKRRIIGALAMLMDSGSLIIIPLIIRDLFDAMASGSTFEHIVPLINKGVLMLLLLAIVRFFAIYAEIFFQEGTGNYISFDLRQLLFKRLVKLPFSYFDRTKTGDLMSILTKDVDAVRDGTGFVIMLVITNLLIVIGIIVAMVLLDPLYALIVLSVYPILALVAVVYSRIIGPLYGAVQKQSGVLHTVAQENVSGIRVVKAFVRHKEEEGKFKRENDRLYQTNIRIAILNSLTHPSLDLLGSLSTYVALCAGAVFVINGRISLGTMIAFINFADNLIWPVRQIGWLAEMFQRATAGAKRIFQILDEKESIPVSTNPNRDIPGDIEFKNVSFKYPNGELALNDFSLKIQGGETVCLLGMNASGKTTVANLLPRFYDVTSGEILIDGVNIVDWDISTLRENIGFVFQDNFLFSASLRDNLTMGRDYSEQEIFAALQAAQAAKFVNELPNGLDTVVGERGIGLSGGERQRIAIARALLRDPQILVFDDSTASLDAQTEANLKEALKTLFKGRTVLIIAQRVSTAMTADKIAVMDAGRIVEQGTHQELLTRNGIYSNLHTLQSMTQRIIEEAE